MKESREEMLITIGLAAAVYCFFEFTTYGAKLKAKIKSYLPVSMQAA